MAKYAQSFTAAARPNAATEMARLKKHPEIVRFIAVERPLRPANVIAFAHDPDADPRLRVRRPLERLLCREVQVNRDGPLGLADNLTRVMNIHRHQALIAAIRP